MSLEGCFTWIQLAGSVWMDILYLHQGQLVLICAGCWLETQIRLSLNSPWGVTLSRPGPLLGLIGQLRCLISLLRPGWIWYGLNKALGTKNASYWMCSRWLVRLTVVFIHIFCLFVCMFVYLFFLQISRKGLPTMPFCSSFAFATWSSSPGIQVTGISVSDILTVVQ